MPDPELDRLFAALQEGADLPHPGDAEITAALDLARVVAHSTVRRAAPLVCYAAGLALGPHMAPAARAAALRDLLAHIEATMGSGDG